jgi:hypothetical protein
VPSRPSRQTTNLHPHTIQGQNLANKKRQIAADGNSTRI